MGERSTCARCASRARRSPATTGSPTSRSRCRASGAGPISLFGTADQRARYLPAVARGEKIAAFALSEPDAGSDVAAMTTAGGRRPAHRHQDVDLQRRDRGLLHRVRARRREGISAFIVEAERGRDRRADRRDRAAPAGDAGLRRHARASRSGRPGAGMKIALSTLDVFRSTVGAAALGFARRALDEALVARARAEAVRRPDGRAPARPGQARRHGAGDRRQRAARLPRGVGEGHDRRPRDAARRRWPSCTPPSPRSASIDARGPAARRARRHLRPPGRAALPRDPRAAHLRGRQSRSSS